MYPIYACQTYGICASFAGHVYLWHICGNNMMKLKLVVLWHIYAELLGAHAHVACWLCKPCSVAPFLFTDIFQNLHHASYHKVMPVTSYVVYMWAS